MKRGLLLVTLFLLVIAPSMHALTAFPLQQNIPPGSSGVIYMNTPDANANYYAAASFATYPGIALPGGRTLPLRFDELFFLTATGSAPNIFQNFLGVLDANGDGTMTINLPNIPELNGLNFYVAFLTVQGSSIATISNPVLVTIGPYQNKIDDHSNLPTGLANMASAVDQAGKRLYIFSGLNARGSLTNVLVKDFNQPLGLQNIILDQILPTRGGAAIFDQAQNKAYIFGGNVNGIDTNTIRTYDILAPAGQRFTTLPSTLHHSTSYTQAIQVAPDKVYIFYGEQGVRDVSKFNPQTGGATLISNALPAAVPQSSAAYIPSQNRVIICCTDSGNFIEFRTDTELASTLSASVSPRTSPLLVYDPNANKVVLLGGYQAPIGSRYITAFDPATNRATTLDQFERWRYGASGTFVAAFNKPMIYGGYAEYEGFSTDILFLTYDSYNRYFFSYPVDADQNYGAAFRDPTTEHIYFIEGRTVRITDGHAYGGTVDINPEAEFPRYASLVGSFSLGLHDFFAAWDTRRNVGYIFGGRDNLNNYLEYGYVFNPRVPSPWQWYTSITGRLPTPRTGTAAAYDSQRDKVYLFGGRQNSPPYYLDQVLEFDPATQNIATLPVVLPIAGSGYPGSAFYDPVSGNTYVFYQAYPPNIFAFTRGPPPSVRILAASLPASSRWNLAYDPVRKVAYLFGNGPAGQTSDIFEFDPATETATYVGTLPTVYYGASAVYSPRFGGVTLVGGAMNGGDIQSKQLAGFH